MTQSDFQTLVVQTLRTPGEAATRLLALNLPRRWLWMAMALMCVLNSIVYSVSLQLSPPTDPAALAMIPPANPFASWTLRTMRLVRAIGSLSRSRALPGTCLVAHQVFQPSKYAVCAVPNDPARLLAA